MSVNPPGERLKISDHRKGKPRVLYDTFRKVFFAVTKIFFSVIGLSILQKYFGDLIKAIEEHSIQGIFIGIVILTLGLSIVLYFNETYFELCYATGVRLMTYEFQLDAAVCRFAKCEKIPWEDYSNMTPDGAELNFLIAVDERDRVFFEQGSTVLSPQAKLIIDRQAIWLLRHPLQNVLVAGNAADDGTEISNLRLSDERAEVVTNYFDGLGIDPARIQRVGYGQNCPPGLAVKAEDRTVIISIQGDNPQDCY